MQLPEGTTWVVPFVIRVVPLTKRVVPITMSVLWRLLQAQRMKVM
jgi:hypothetical protein